MITAAAAVALAVWLLLASPASQRTARLVAGSGEPAGDFVERLWRRRPVSAHRRRLQMLRTVADLLEVWASAVAVGMPVHQGLDEAWQVVEIPLRNGRDNGDRWSVLAGSAVPATRLPQLCWQLHRSAGIAIGPVLHRCAESVRDEITMAEEAMAQAAAPLATARLLAALPIAGPLLGAAVGADVVAVLFGTSIGRACLIVGLGLDLLGLWWMRRIVRAAGRSS